MQLKISLVIAACLVLTNVTFGTIDVAIIYNDENIISLARGLAGYNDFGKIAAINWASTPDPTKLVGYECVIVTSIYNPVANSAQWGNIIADYAETGGGVVLGFAFFSTGGPLLDYGKLEDTVHSPFARGSVLSGSNSFGSILIPDHPLMSSVDELTTSYRYDVSVNPGATVVATFDNGIPLAGYMNVGAGRVVGIQADYTENPYFTNTGDYMQLYRNAAVYSTPEPSSVILLGLGGVLLRSRKKF